MDENLEFGRQNRVDDIESTYLAQIALTGCADEQVCTTDMLEAEGRYWSIEMHNDVRSPRSKEEASKIVGRLAFEITLRKNETHLLEQWWSLKNGENVDA